MFGLQVEEVVLTGGKQRVDFTFQQYLYFTFIFLNFYTSTVFFYYRNGNYYENIKIIFVRYYFLSFQLLRSESPIVFNSQ